jgi:hypothetical protein
MGDLKAGPGGRAAVTTLVGEFPAVRKEKTMNRWSTSSKAALVLLAVALLVTVGCAKPPQEHIDSVRALVSEVQGEDAPTYADSAWRDLQTAWQAVNTEVEAQAAKNGFSRNYKRTEELLAETERLATAAREAAITGKQAAQAAAQEGVETAKTAVADAQAALDALNRCRRKPKGFAADSAALSARVSAISDRIPALESQIASGAFAAARTAVQAVVSEAQALVAELTSAKEKMRC